MERYSDAITMSSYIPKKHWGADIMARLQKLSGKRDRTVNHLVVQAILEYLDREEKKH